MQLNDPELKILELLWEKGEMRAGQICKDLAEKTGWRRNTIYTVITRCVDKGLIERKDPHFICRAAISKEEARKEGMSDLIHRLFSDSPKEFVMSFVSRNDITKEDINELKAFIEKMK